MRNGHSTLIAVLDNVMPRMKLQQLRFLVAIAQNDLNISAAAAKIRSSQPAMSRQLRLLEEELGFDIFTRSGHALTRVTPQGARVLERASRILHETRAIGSIRDDILDQNRGTLSIGATHTQARYVLPRVVKQFRARYPGVDVHLHQGNTEQIAEMAKLDRIDFALASGNRDLFAQYVLMPAYELDRKILVPPDHPLTRIKRLSLERVAEYPIVTYAFGFTGRTSIRESFLAAGLTPNIALSARDSDVIKTYVRLGLGVGIVAGVAIDDRADADLVSMDAMNLFPRHATWIGFMRGGLLRTYMYDFLQLLAPHLTRKLVERAAATARQEEVDALVARVEVPVH